jgi:hypothetical protein
MTFEPTPPVEPSPPVEPPGRPRSAGLAATLAVAGVMLLVVFGGFAVSDALSQPAGPPVGIGGVARVKPLSGWQVTGRFTEPNPPGIRLTRGAGNLDVVAIIPFSGDASDLVAWYVDRVLEPQSRRLSVSSSVEALTLASGLEGARITYVGLFGKSQAPIEGEVTAVVSPSGVGVVFDAWGPEGVLRYIVDDVRTMIDTAEVA